MGAIILLVPTLICTVKLVRAKNAKTQEKQEVQLAGIPEL